MPFVPSAPGISVPNSRTSITSFTKFSHEARMKLKNGLSLELLNICTQSPRPPRQWQSRQTLLAPSGHGEDVGSHCKCDIDHGAGGVPRGRRSMRHLGETCPSVTATERNLSFSNSFH